MKKILIPVDDSEYSERAVAQGKMFAETFGSDVVLLHVVSIQISNKRFATVTPHSSPNEDPYVIMEKAHATEFMKKYKESFGERMEHVETDITYGIVADEIIRVANESDVDFVIMGSHGIGSALYRGILGSVTSKVIHHVKKPMLVIR